MSNPTLPPEGFKQTLTAAHYDRMRLGKYSSAKFSNVPECARQVVRNYIQNLRQMVKQGYGLYIHGSYGSGKTYTSAVIAKYAAHLGYTAIMIPCADIPHLAIDKHKHVFSTNECMLDRLHSVNLLVIDDLGTEKESDWSVTQISNLLRQRNLSGNTATIITSNIAFDPGDRRSPIITRYGADTFDLLSDLTVPVEVSGDSSIRRSRANHIKELLYERKKEDESA